LKRAARLLRGLLILSSFWLQTQPGLPAPPGKKLLTLQEVIHSDSIVAPGISGLRWRPGGKQLTYVRPGPPGATRLCAYDLERRTETVLFDPSIRKEKVALDSYQWSPRGDAILLEGENDLWLLEAQSGQLRRLTQDEDAEEVPAFSPAGDRIAFVKKHDLYVLDLEKGAARRLTQDGSGTVYNGRLDWVYEEELADRSTARAFEWSPDGKHLAYLRLDDGPVPEYPITDYLGAHVRLVSERFPQPGDSNPRASLHVVAVEDAAAQPARLTLDAQQVEYLGPAFAWTPDATALCFLALNRAQTEISVHRWEPGSGRDRVLFVEHDPYWVNSLEPPRFLEGGREFLWVSERDGWQHVYLYTAEGKLVRQITRGAWMLDRPVFQDAPLFQLDPQEKWLYFAATHPDPRERQLQKRARTRSTFRRMAVYSQIASLRPTPRP
jgi:dipeptidyl-peptidase-4